MCPECCIVSAGGSQDLVSDGAPGSRHKSAGEILHAEVCPPGRVCLRVE